MNTERLLQISRVTRPLMRRKRPIVYRLCKRILRKAYPPPRPGAGHELITHFEGGALHIDTSSSLEYQLLFQGCHEPDMAHLLTRLIQPGFTCIDVGANMGAHTLVMARATGEKGRVLALEPHPTLCKRLEANVALNDYGNITIIEAALSSEDGSTTFYGFDTSSSTHSTSSLRPNKDAQESMTVKTLCGATLQKAHALTSCDVIKIDVEGAETIVLASISELIRQTQPYITFEYRERLWSHFDGSIDAVVQTLRSQDYALYVIGQRALRTFDGRPPDHSDILCVPPNRPLPQVT